MRGAPVGEPEESADGTRLQAGPRSRSLGRAGWALPGKPTPPSRLFPSTVDFNNIGLNCEGSLTCGNFSVVNSTVLRNLWLVEPIDVGP